jgi:hypothetical protein
VQVLPDDAAVMLDEAALGAMSKVLVAGGRQKRDGNNNNEEPARKKRRNTAAADTGLGLGCSKALYDCDRRDKSQNENALATKLKQTWLRRYHVSTLTVLDNRKKGL